MDITIDQQVALDEALVPHESRLRIGKSNFRLKSDISSKESTLQLVYDVLRLTPFYKAFLVIVDVPEIYMQEFWATATVHHNSIRFKMDNKKRIVNLEYFREMMHICPRLPAIINKCLSRKSTGYDSLRLSQAQILWGLYHKKNVDFTYLLWEDFIYQVKHKDVKKSNEMYYPRDDQMFTMIKLVSRHQNTQQFGAMLPIELTNEDIKNSKSYNEYYAVATGAAPPKTKASIRKTKSSSDTQSLLQLLMQDDDNQDDDDQDEEDDDDNQDEGNDDDQDSDNEGEEFIYPKLSIHDEDETKDEESFDPIAKTPENSDDEGNDEENLGLNVGREEGQDEEDDEDELYRDVNINLEGRVVQMADLVYKQDFTYLLWEDFIYQVKHKDVKKSNEMYYPRDDQMFTMIKLVSRHQNTQQFGAMLPIELTNEDIKNSKSYNEYYAVATGAAPPKTKASIRKTKSSSDTQEEGQDEEDDEDELYRDVNINLEGRVSPSVSSQFITSMLNPTPDAEIDSIFEKTSQMDVQAPTTVASLTLSVPTLTPSTIATISTVPQAPTPPTTASSTLLQDLPNVGLLFGFDHRLKTLEANFSEFVQTNQFARAVSSIPKIVQRYMDQRMNEAVKVAVQIQYDRLRNEAQAENEEFLVKAYESDKIILDTYRDTVTLKRCRDDDADKDEEPSAGSDWGSKRRREGKEPESTSALKEKATRITGKSTQGSKSQQKTATDSAPVAEPMRTTHDLEEPSHQEFVIGATDDQPIAEASQHPKWFQQQKKPSTPDHTLTPELLAVPTYEQMKGSYKSLFDHFINYNLEYLRGGASSHKYTTSVTKTKAADYGHTMWNEDLVPRTMWSQERKSMTSMLSVESLIGGANVNSTTDLQSTGSLLEMSTLNIESSLSLSFRLSSGTVTSI
nr:hypothetical protein [Tanacetum cinerariifolium]